MPGCAEIYNMLTIGVQKIFEGSPFFYFIFLIFRYIRFR